MPTRVIASNSGHNDIHEESELIGRWFDIIRRPSCFVPCVQPTEAGCPLSKVGLTLQCIKTDNGLHWMIAFGPKIPTKGHELRVDPAEYAWALIHSVEETIREARTAPVTVVLVLNLGG